jgi:hypothetical protein
MKGQIRNMAVTHRQIAIGRAQAKAESNSIGGWEVRRVLKSGKLGAVCKDFRTGQAEYSEAAAQAEAARLCELNGAGSFQAVAK